MIKNVMALYRGTKSIVKTRMGMSREFEIGVGVHQGSPLSPLFITGGGGVKGGKRRGTVGTSICG